jgi:Ran GTPase-activating protein (RanGAP) involved in mRNA processing and transport
VKLSLAHNNIADQGVLLLSEALTTKISHLKELDLSSNHITNAGAQYLSKMLTTYRTLTHIWLDDNELGDAGVRVLANAIAEYGVHLKNLSLSQNKSVTDTSVEYLINMYKKRPMDVLWMRYCSLSESGKGKFRLGLGNANSFSKLYI